jgi:hypothetical protein
LIYLWTDSEFHDPEVVDKIALHPDVGILSRLMSEHEKWNIPDFRPWGRIYKLDLQTTTDIAETIIPSIHHIK